MQKKIVSIVILIVVYFVSAGISYSIFKADTSVDAVVPQKNLSASDSDTENDYQALVFDKSQAKTKECPLNGVMYGKDQYDWWTKHRPLGVMIENHADSRPQSGITFADVTYEAVAEGGITRTLNVYYCQDAGIIGPIRSARTYFLDFISEYGDYPLYAHVGGANTPGPANALGQIGDYGWTIYNDLNQFSIGYPTFWRDEGRLGRDVATEHTMYSTTSKLWAVSEKRGLTSEDKEGSAWDVSFVKYSFKEDETVGVRPVSQKIHIEYWNNEAYYIDWAYDKKLNLYLRNNGGAEHIDRNTKQQMNARNVIVLYMVERHANDGYEDNAHLLYGTRGQGKAVIFMDGKKIDGTWKKKSRTDRTVILDEDGSEVKFNRGKIWFEILPTDGVVKVS